MEEIHFTNIDFFLTCIQTKPEERKSNIIYNLRLDFDRAIDELHAKFSRLLDSEKCFYGKKIIEIIDLIVSELSLSQQDEKELLANFRYKVRLYVMTPIIRNSKPNPLFKDITLFEDVLFEFDMIDGEGNIIIKNKKPRRGFQALSNAMRENTYFQTNVFKRKPDLIDYVEFLNNKYNLKLSSSKLSISGEYKDKLEKYLRDIA